MQVRAKDIAHAQMSHMPQVKIGNSDSLKTRQIENKSAIKSQGTFQAALRDMSREMTAADLKIQNSFQGTIHKLPAEARSLVEVQCAVHQLQLRTELMSKAAESVSSTFKRLQQMGG